MPASALKPLAKRAGIPLPAHTVVDVLARARATGILGGEARIKRYGRIARDEEYRKKRWRKWWNEHGSTTLPESFVARAVVEPKKSVALAEFIGIMMGDGGLSKYQAVISLNTVDDAEYVRFVAAHGEMLFGVRPTVRAHKETCVTTIVFSRANLVQILHRLGLPIGDKLKQGLDMPQWIRKNRAYSISCMRGLVDTDGCIFTHRYIAKGKRYTYKKLSFKSASPALVASVYTLLTRLGMSPRVSRDGRDVRLESAADVRRYFTLIGSSNPKHLKRYAK